MNDHAMKNDLHTLKSQLKAWRDHVHALELDDRQRFIEWLPKELSADEFALIIDGEILRDALWEVYLNEHYGT
jgi:hypothetical protein